MAWVAHQIVHDPLHLFDANIFYPERNTLAFSDAMLVPSAMIAPLVWLGVPHLLAYNLLLLSAFALSGAAMFALVRSLTGQTGAAWQIATTAALTERGGAGRPEALRLMTQRYIEHMHTNEPVHTWPAL